jgi:hypothetical protein
MYSRRNVLRSFGLAAASCLLPALALAQPRSGLSLASSRNRVQLIDADFAVTKYVEKIRATGVTSIGRYYDRTYGSGTGETCWHNPTKVLAKDELRAIEDAGLSVFVIFQHCSADCMNFNIDNVAMADRGRKDALAAIRLAADLGQPAETPIYFGIDFDPMRYGSCTIATERVLSSIEAYFSEINELLAKTRWLVGIYGCGRTSQFLRDRKLAQYFWLSASLGHEGTDEFFNSGQWHIYQNSIDIQKDYAKKGDEFIDVSVVNPTIIDPEYQLPYFGAWTTKGRAAGHDIGISRDILASRAFFKRACGYKKDAGGKLLPKASKAMFDSTCRLISEEAGGYFGVSVTEGDEIEGYVHQSDIIGGLWRNMPRFNPSNVCAPAPKLPLSAVSRL